jgi:hypothetical protein
MFFGVGDQVLISGHRKVLSSKTTVVNVAETAEQDSAGNAERGERKRTADELSARSLCPRLRTSLLVCSWP